jgi:hypothetical protein
MPSYETLDAIADSYNPLLLVAAVVVLGLALWKKEWRLAGVRVLGIGIVLGVTYGLRFLESTFGWWGTRGLDYSTHTALSVSFVVFLTITTRKLAAFWIGSLLAYFALMLYQKYHTLADILSTSLVVIVPVLVGCWYLRSAGQQRAVR